MANENVPQTEAAGFLAEQSAERAREFALALEVANRKFETEGHQTGPLEVTWSARDRFDIRMGQAYALAAVISCEGKAAFDSLNESIRDDYLSVLRDLIGAARVDAEIEFSKQRSLEAEA